MPNLEIEKQYYGIVAGVDEAGRGPLAGPVVAAAVILNQKNIASGINDSKKLYKAKREELFEHIIANHKFSIGIVSSEIIDEINILQATIKACRMAIEGLPIIPDFVLIDGNMSFGRLNYISIIKGDNHSLSIAAASIIAKVTRDRMMQQMHLEYPQYCWNQNMGYGTKNHFASIKEFGITPYHRKSWNLGV